MMVNSSDEKITVQNVADYFIYKSKFDDKNRSTVSPLKLQKLIYYAQAWYSTFNQGKKLFNDEIEAWVHGPVVPTIYHEFKQFGYNDISKNITNIPNSIQRSNEIQTVLDVVWNMYGQMDAKALEKLTHSEEPWQKARGKLSPYQLSNAKISVDSMANYYNKYLEKRSE